MQHQIEMQAVLTYTRCMKSQCGELIEICVGGLKQSTKMLRR